VQRYGGRSAAAAAGHRICLSGEDSTTQYRGRGCFQKRTSVKQQQFCFIYYSTRVQVLLDLLPSSSFFLLIHKFFSSSTLLFYRNLKRFSLFTCIFMPSTTLCELLELLNRTPAVFASIFFRTPLKIALFLPWPPPRRASSWACLRNNKAQFPGGSLSSDWPAAIIAS
jgi:hypothetical protein